MSTTVLGIPTVTESDLHSFHAKHFPHSIAPSQFFITSAEQISSTTHQPAIDAQDDSRGYDEEYEEDLGTYPDGTARTLTDEQIAMFRHSEIQALIRERRRAREEAAEDDDEMYSPAPVTATSANEGSSAAKDGEVVQTTSRSDEGSVSMTPEIVLDNPSAKRKAHRGKKQKKKRSRDRQWAQQNNNTQKRKWDEYVDGEDGSTHTHRRRARELDEQREESVELTY